jgi:6-phosphofructokinase
MIGSGRDKIESAADLAAAAETVQALDLDGLVIVGGDDSNTNAAFLAEYFIAKGEQELCCHTRDAGLLRIISGCGASARSPCGGAAGSQYRNPILEAHMGLLVDANVGSQCWRCWKPPLYWRLLVLRMPTLPGLGEQWHDSTRECWARNDVWALPRRQAVSCTAAQRQRPPRPVQLVACAPRHRRIHGCRVKLDSSIARVAVQASGAR